CARREHARRRALELPARPLAPGTAVRQDKAAEPTDAFVAIKIEPKLRVMLIRESMRHLAECFRPVQCRRKRTRFERRRDDELRVLFRSFVAADEMCAVLDDRAGQYAAELLLIERSARAGQRVRRVQAPGAIVNIAGAVKIIRAA